MKESSGCGACGISFSPTRLVVVVGAPVGSRRSALVGGVTRVEGTTTPVSVKTPKAADSWFDEAPFVCPPSQSDLCDPKRTCDRCAVVIRRHNGGD